MSEKLNELEKIGLAFLSGLAAGGALEEMDNKTEGEDMEEVTKKVVVEKIEGKKAEKFMEMLRRWGIE